MRPVSIAQLRAHATVDLMTAAQALKLGRTTAYKLAKRGEFPCRVIRVRGSYRVPVPGLLELLGVEVDPGRGPAHTADPAPRGADRAAGPRRRA